MWNPKEEWDLQRVFVSLFLLVWTLGNAILEASMMNFKFRGPSRMVWLCVHKYHLPGGGAIYLCRFGDCQTHHLEDGMDDPGIKGWKKQNCDVLDDPGICVSCSYGGFHTWGYPQNGWFVMEHPSING